jgi:hypothetical protein
MIAKEIEKIVSENLRKIKKKFWWTLYPKKKKKKNLKNDSFI